MRIDSSGNVGIGTSSPNFTLDVEGSTGIKEGSRLVWHDGSGNAAADIYADASDNLVFRNTSSNSERMRIDSSGNVGIGTSSPDSILHLSESDNNSATTGFSNGGLQIENTDITSGSWTQLHLKANSKDAHIRLDNTGLLSIFNDDVTAAVMAIDSSGNVGIGTSSPAAKLDVNGTLACDGFTSTGIDDNATSTAITIDASENVGIGVVPSDTHAAFDTIEFNTASIISQSTATAGNLVLGSNMNYSSGGGPEYKVTGKATQITQVDGNITLGVATSGTANTAISFNTAMTIANAGDVTVGTGNLVIGTSGKGIDFSADGNAAGMTSEVLDDYEEGTFTATLTGSTAAPTTAVTATFAYVKIGRQVTINGHIVGDTTGATGNMRLTGLPFTNGSNQAIGAYMSEGLAATQAYNIAYLGAVDYIQFYSVTNAANWAAVPILAGASKGIMVSLTYQV
jgi:hypothetical protein